MVKKYLSIALLGATAVTITSCSAQNTGFKKTAAGLEYKIVKDEPGIQKAAIGDEMQFQVKTYVRFPKADSVLYDTYTMNNGKPVPYQVMPPGFKGDVSEGFMMLTKGDSAVFRMSIDSMLKAGMQLAPWMEKGKGMKMEFAVKVTSVMTQGQKASEEENKIKDYLSKNNIQATRTPSGLYYVIEKMGTGAAPKAGNTVSMNYTGMTLEGTKFDSNVDPQFNHVQPFEFKLGAGQVIKGWDEGIALMPKGTKGKLIIPSTMAYGAQSPTPLIQPNSVLVFDVEVVDFHE